MVLWTWWQNHSDGLQPCWCGLWLKHWTVSEPAWSAEHHVWCWFPGAGGALQVAGTPHHHQVFSRDWAKRRHDQGMDFAGITLVRSFYHEYANANFVRLHFVAGFCMWWYLLCSYCMCKWVYYYFWACIKNVIQCNGLVIIQLCSCELVCLSKGNI